MKGRSFRRALWRGRQGTRSYVSVRLPRSVLPVQPPSLDFCKDWGEADLLNGHWKLTCPDGRLEIRSIGAVWGDPPQDRPFHFLAATPAGLVWWEGALSIQGPDLELEAPLDILDLPEADIAAHKAYLDWYMGYLDGFVEVDRGPILEAFIRAGDAAKTHGVSLTETHLTITYAVKHEVRSRALQFCRSLKRACQIAHRHGVQVKLLNIGLGALA